MKTSYEISIKSSRNKLKFKGIFYKDIEKNKFYFRALEDSSNYGDMFEELLSDSAIDISNKNNKNKTMIDDNYEIINHDIVHTDFEDIESLVEYLKNDGFIVESQKIEENFSTLSVVVDGKDLNPEVISFKENDKITTFAHSLFQYANNVNYEPKYKIRASSFAVDIQEFNNNDRIIKEFVEDIKTLNIDINKYFENIQYSKMISDLKKVVVIDTIKSFKIITNSFEAVLEISKIKEFNKIIKNKPFVDSIDVKNLRVLLDSDKVYSLHIKDKKVFNNLKMAQGTIKPLKSYFIAKQTIEFNGFK
jgi:hypothetical protein